MPLAALAGLTLSGGGCRTVAEVGETVIAGEERQLRDRPERDRLPSPKTPSILIIALDGVNAPTLYDALRKDEMPGLATLLGGPELDHAYLHPGMIASLPTVTVADWTTAFTGVSPAEHGVPGNEFFVRHTAHFAAPSPVSYSDTAQVLQTLNDRTLDRLIEAPTLYEQLRAHEPDIRIWVANHPITRGADRLVVAEPSAILEALVAVLSHELNPVDDDARAIPAELDQETLATLKEHLDPDDAPDVLTVYLAGPDLYAHKARDPTRVALSQYLRDEVDPLMLDLYRELERTGTMANRYVIVTADHGHTDVMPDDAHALGRSDGGAVQDVLAAAGFTPRPSDREASGPFSAVIAYAGAMAMVYVADRSRCTAKSCDWRHPPRRRHDLLAAADALHRGVHTSSSPLRGKLDLILVRAAQGPEPFEIYEGNGQTVDLRAWLAEHPRPSYVRLPERLRDLGVEPYADRAGDIILIANNGNKDEPAERFYFDQPYESWHGSPSFQDSVVPLIVAHPQHTTAELSDLTDRVIAPLADQDRFTPLVLRLRAGSQEGPGHGVASRDAAPSTGGNSP